MSNPLENSSFRNRAADVDDVNLPMPLSFALKEDDCNYSDDNKGDDDDDADDDEDLPMPLSVALRPHSKKFPLSLQRRKP